MSHDIQCLSVSVFHLEHWQGEEQYVFSRCTWWLWKWSLILISISHTFHFCPTIIFIHSFIHSIGMCRMRRFLAGLRSFFHSSLLCTNSCHPSPPIIRPSSLTLSCHLFLGLPLNLVVPKFIYNTLLGILFSSILCTSPNQHNLFNLIVSIIVGFLTLAYISLLVNILQFSFSLSCTGPKILLYTFLSKMINCFLSLFVGVQVSDA